MRRLLEIVILLVLLLESLIRCRLAAELNVQLSSALGELD